MNYKEQKALEIYPVKEKTNKNGTGTYDANLPRRKAFIKGFDCAYEMIMSERKIPKIETKSYSQ